MTAGRVEPVEPHVAAGRPRRRLVAVRAATTADWSEAIAAAQWPVPEQSPEWIAAMCAPAWTSDSSRAYRFDDGAVAVLPLVRRGVGSASSLWSPLPAWGVGGVVGDVDRAVVSAVVDDLRTLDAMRVSVRIDEWQEPFWSDASTHDDLLLERCVHVIDMQANLDDQFRLLNKNTRRAVRRAGENDVEVRVDTTGALIDNHYDLFLRSVERWATRQHEPRVLARARARRRDPISKLVAMQKALGERCVVVAAFVGGRPAASNILLLGPTARYTRGALDTDVAGSTGANDAVQWRAIELAHEYGSRRYHLGESGTSTGLATFKEKFGATPRRHHEYRFERIPMTRAGFFARSAVKRVIGFDDR